MRHRRGLSDAHFAVRRRQVAEAVCVEVEGELDPATAPQLARELAGAAAEGAPRVVLDLAAVTFLESTALRVLVNASLELRARGGELVVRQPEGPARRLFELVGLDRPLVLLGNGDDNGEATSDCSAAAAAALVRLPAATHT